MKVGAACCLFSVTRSTPMGDDDAPDVEPLERDEVKDRNAMMFVGEVL